MEDEMNKYKGTQTEKNLETAFAGESQARNKYTYFASVAKKEVFEQIFTQDVNPEAYVEEKGLKTVNDEGALRKTVEGVIASNPQSVSDYKGGKEKALGFLVGQTMKQMKGKADPAAVNKLLKELLS